MHAPIIYKHAKALSSRCVPLHLQMAEKPKFCPCDLGDVFDYQPLGCEVSIEHIKAYVKKPSSQTDAAVLVIHDIFGGQLPNTRYIADLLASNGYM